MKIVQIGPYPPPVGGWSLHIKFFAEYLREKEIENTVLDIGPNRKTHNSDCVDVQSGFDYLKKNLRYLGKGYHIYMHADGGPTKGLMLTLISIFCSLLFGKRIFLSFHAGINQKCFSNKHSIKKFLFTIVFLMSKAIICNSNNVKEKIVQLGIKPDKIHAIPCFTPKHLEFAEKLTDEQSSFYSKFNPIIFCYILFGPDYTPDLLLETFKNVIKKLAPDAGLVLAGGVRGEDERNYFDTQVGDIINKLEIKNDILEVGDIPHDNFLSLMKNSDLVIRTHLRDGVCSSVLEAVNLGVPVLACYNETRPEGVITYTGKDKKDMFNKAEYVIKNLQKIKDAANNDFTRDTLLEEFKVIVSSSKKQSV